LLLLGLAWVGWWILSPDFIELDVPMPPHRSGVKDVWDEESRARVRYTGSPDGCDYVLRRRGLVDPSRHAWKSQEQIVEYFHRWLTARGWVVPGNSPSFNVALPEDDFLVERHPGAVRWYVRAGDQWGDEGWVVVAVWPWSPGEPSTYYHVVLASKRPSFTRRLLRSFD
jgi:hypothetical protein